MPISSIGWDALLIKGGIMSKDRTEYMKAHNKAWYIEHREETKAKKRVYGVQYRLANPCQRLLCCAKYRAKKAGVPFALTKEWASTTYTGLCAITGIPFVIEGGDKRGPKPFSPSIDRVIPELGYVPENCRFVLCAINAFRGIMTDEQMREVAKAILNPIHDRDVNAARNILRRGHAAPIAGAAA